MASERLDEIVNDCLERMAGGEPVEACLASYPEDRGQLAPLLETAATTLIAATTVGPDVTARQRGLQKFNEAVAQRATRKSGLRFPRFIWQSPIARPVVAVALVLLVTTGMALGADVAASNSIPGDSLYWVKTSKENIMMRLPKSDMSKAKDHVRLAQKRGDEMGMLLDKGMYVEAEKHYGEVNRNIGQTVDLVGLRMSTNTTEMPTRGFSTANRAELDAIKAILERNWTASHSALSVHLVSASDKDRVMISKLIQRNKLMYRTLIAFLESGDSPNWPPFYRTEPPRRLNR
jgi:hypothetical protein